MINRIMRKAREWLDAKRRNNGNDKSEIIFMSRLESGKKVHCIYEKQLKVFDAETVEITGTEGCHAGGLMLVTLANGIRFRGTETRTRFTYTDRERLSGAPEMPTRATVTIFSTYLDARKHLQFKGADRFIGKLENCDEPENATNL